MSTTTSGADIEEDGQETVISVSAELANGSPLGFSLDAGGSVVKLIYRSKLDYIDGKPIGGQDVLRFRFHPNNKRHELVPFIKENCDVRSTPVSPTDELPVVYLTGVGTQNLKEDLEKELNCRVKVVSEMDLVADGITHVANYVPLLKQQLPVFIDVAEKTLADVRSFMLALKRHEEVNMNAYGEKKAQIEGFDLMGYIMKLMTVDVKTFADELSTTPLKYPCLLVQCGSATNISVLHEDGKLGLGGFCPVAAKTFLALGRALTGAKNADELIEMASKGDWRKVDLTVGNLKTGNANEDDWYSIMPDHLLVFSLGRLAEEEYDGKYTKEDIAAGLLHMQCQIVARYSFEMARVHNVKSILYSGSFAQWPAARRLLQQSVLPLLLLGPIVAQSSLTMHILPQSGFFPSLGAWYRNVQELQKNATP